jgi:hypothetical protein
MKYIYVSILFLTMQTNFAADGNSIKKTTTRIPSDDTSAGEIKDSKLVTEEHVKSPDTSNANKNEQKVKLPIAPIPAKPHPTFR